MRSKGSVLAGSGDALLLLDFEFDFAAGKDASSVSALSSEDARRALLPFFDLEGVVEKRRWVAGDSGVGDERGCLLVSGWGEIAHRDEAGVSMGDASLLLLQSSCQRASIGVGMFHSRCSRLTTC